MATAASCITARAILSPVTSARTLIALDANLVNIAACAADYFVEGSADLLDNILLGFALDAFDILNLLAHQSIPSVTQLNQTYRSSIAQICTVVNTFMLTDL